MLLTSPGRPIVNPQIKKDEYYIKKLENKIKYLEIGIEEIYSNLSSVSTNSISVNKSLAIVKVLKEQIKI